MTSTVGWVLLFCSVLKIYGKAQDNFTAFCPLLMEMFKLGWLGLFLSPQPYPAVTTIQFQMFSFRFQSREATETHSYFSEQLRLSGSLSFFLFFF